MLMTKRKPATVGEILIEEFMRPLRVTQPALAQALGVQSKHVNELCNNRRNVTAATALIPCPRIWQQPRFPAERAAPQRSMGSDKQPLRG
jgi:antitoxin HigA-1